MKTNLFIIFSIFHIKMNQGMPQNIVTQSLGVFNVGKGNVANIENTLPEAYSKPGDENGPLNLVNQFTNFVNTDLGVLANLNNNLGNPAAALVPTDTNDRVEDDGVEGNSEVDNELLTYLLGNRQASLQTAPAITSSNPADPNLILKNAIDTYNAYVAQVQANFNKMATASIVPFSIKIPIVG